MGKYFFRFSFEGALKLTASFTFSGELGIVDSVGVLQSVSAFQKQADKSWLCGTFGIPTQRLQEPIAMRGRKA